MHSGIQLFFFFYFSKLYFKISITQLANKKVFEKKQQVKKIITVFTGKRFVTQGRISSFKVVLHLFLNLCLPIALYEQLL